MCLMQTDLRQGKSGKQLVVDYSKTWMKPSLTLNYVNSLLSALLVFLRAYVIILCI